MLLVKTTVTQQESVENAFKAYNAYPMTSESEARTF